MYKYVVPVILCHHSASSQVNFLPQIDLTSWFRMEGLLWHGLDPLPQLVPLFGMCFLLLFALFYFQAVSLLASPLSKSTRFFFSWALHTGSASEWFTPVEAL